MHQVTLKIFWSDQFQHNRYSAVRQALWKKLQNIDQHKEELCLICRWLMCGINLMTFSQWIKKINLTGNIHRTFDSVNSWWHHKMVHIMITFNDFHVSEWYNPTTMSAWLKWLNFNHWSMNHSWYFKYKPTDDLRRSPHLLVTNCILTMVIP